MHSHVGLYPLTRKAILDPSTRQSRNSAGCAHWQSEPPARRSRRVRQPHLTPPGERLLENCPHARHPGKNLGRAPHPHEK